MSDKQQPLAANDRPAHPAPPAPTSAPPRLNSRELIPDGNGVEIDHDGRIYRLRITQHGKLILTA